MSNNDDNLVYSTELGRVKPSKPQSSNINSFSDGVIRIKRETKGRKGKGVTTVTGIDSQANNIKNIAANLKKHCGTGGSIKNGIIEIQGDKRETIKQELEKLGFKVKFAGG